MGHAPSAEPPPTISEIEEAVALLRRVRHYERMGVRMIIVSPGDPIRLRPVGQAVDLKLESQYNKGV